MLLTPNLRELKQKTGVQNIEQLLMLHAQLEPFIIKEQSGIKVQLIIPEYLQIRLYCESEKTKSLTKCSWKIQRQIGDI